MRRLDLPEQLAIGEVDDGNLAVLFILGIEPLPVRREPIRWRTVLRMTKLGRPPLW